MVELETAWSGRVFNCEMFGTVVRSAGKAVRNDAVVASVEVSWTSIAWVSAGMPVHDPLLPVAVMVMVSLAPSGVERGPIWPPALVSMSRHGAIAVIRLPPPEVA